MAGDLSANITVIGKIRDANNNLKTPFDLRLVLSALKADQNSSQFNVPGGSVDLPLPLGSITKPYLLLMNLSRKATLKFDAGDTGQSVGPGFVGLMSSDDGFSTTILFTTAAGEDLCVEYVVAGDNT